MLLNGKTQLGLAFDKYMQDQIFKLHYDKYLTSTDIFGKIQATTEIGGLMREDKNINYLFKQTALEVASRIKLDKGKFEDLSFLSNNLKAKKCTYLMGKDKFFRWHRAFPDGDIIVICVKFAEVDEEYKELVEGWRNELKDLSNKEILTLIESSKNKLSEYDYLAMKNAALNKDFKEHISKALLYYMWGIRDGKLHFPENEKNEDFYKEMMEFVRILIFTELSELETTLLKPKEKVGSRKTFKAINESTKNVTIVDSTWNKILVSQGGFKVAGHFRLQPYGAGLQYRRLQFIDEYEKHGYIRNAKKEDIV